MHKNQDPYYTDHKWVYRSLNKWFAKMKTAVIVLPLVLAGGLCSCSRSAKVAFEPYVLVVDVLKKPLPESEEKRREFLVRTFFKEEDKFDSYTTDNWKSNFTAFASVLVQKAQEQKLDSVSLRSTLDLVLKDSQDRIAYLPVGAYQTTLGEKPVWIVTVKWEYLTHDMGTLRLGHIRVFAFDQKTLERVAFMSCG